MEETMKDEGRRMVEQKLENIKMGSWKNQSEKQNGAFHTETTQPLNHEVGR